MYGRYDNILETVGRSPVVRLERMAPAGVDLYAKIEPLGSVESVRARLAVGVIEEAERTGRLRPGQTVVEAAGPDSSAAMAVVCARKGYPLVVTMREDVGVERRRLKRFLGARVVLTPAAAGGPGVLAKAAELAEAHGWFLVRPSDHDAVVEMQSRSTAHEILDDFPDGLDYWVAGIDTAGSLNGIARVLRREQPLTKIVVCESHQSLRSAEPGCKAAENGTADDLIDLTVPISGAEALRLSRELACKEGILVGASAGATLAGAMEVCRTAPRGSTILCMFPGNGGRCPDAPLFDDLAVEMTDEEFDLSQSTPGYRRDRPEA